jgi:hypothetical protein
MNPFGFEKKGKISNHGKYFQKKTYFPVLHYLAHIYRKKIKLESKISRTCI